jgi:hypothetical protein
LFCEEHGIAIHIKKGTSIAEKSVNGDVIPPDTQKTVPIVIQIQNVA